MKIDVFNHIVPKRFFERMMTNPEKSSGLRRCVSEIPVLVNLDHRFRMMGEFDDYAQLVSLPSLPSEDRKKIYEDNARRLLRLRLA